MDNQNELIEQPSWWKRNWKWAVPVGGCLTFSIVVVILIVGGAFAFANKIQTETGSDQALIEAQANPRLIEVLGEPIERNGIGSFNISIKNGVKSSNSTMPIKGPKGKATIHIVTREEGENRVYDVYTITIAGSEEVIELKEP